MVAVAGTSLGLRGLRDAFADVSVHPNAGQDGPNLHENLMDVLVGASVDRDLTNPRPAQPDPNNLAEKVATLESAMQAVRQTKGPTKLETGKMTTAGSQGIAGVQREIQGGANVVDTAEKAHVAMQEEVDKGNPRLKEQFAEKVGGPAKQDMAQVMPQPQQMDGHNGQGSFVTSQQSGGELASALDVDDSVYRVSASAPEQRVDVMSSPVPTVMLDPDEVAALPGRISEIVEPSIAPEHDEDIMQCQKILDGMKVEIAELRHSVEEARGDLHHHLQGPLTENIGEANVAKLNLDDEAQAKLAINNPDLNQETMRTAFISAKPFAPGAI